MLLKFSYIIKIIILKKGVIMDAATLLIVIIIVSFIGVSALTQVLNRSAE